jgi:hypothetical protein
MANFNITVDSFGITQTRSKHEDTNFIGMTFKLGTKLITAFQSLSNVNNGTHPVNLSIPDVEIDTGDSFVFNYLIVNAGSANGDQVRAALEATGTAWANGGGPPAPHLASANGVDTDYLVAQLVGIFRSTCDGIVAAEQNQLSFGQLPITQNTPQPGTHSPSGCGNNSQYSVQWHIATTPGPMPDVEGPLTAAEATLRSKGLTNFTPSGTGPYVVNQTPSPNAPVDTTTKITLFLGKTQK